MIAWFNRNQGFVLALLTFVYVVTTIIMARLTRLSLQQVKELEKSRLRPHVLFNLVSKYKAVHAVLRNDGLSPAKNITVTLSPDLVTKLGPPERRCVFVEKPLLFLAGGQEIEDLLGGAPAFDSAFKEVVFKGTLAYQDESGGRYSEPIEISMWHIMNRYHTTTDLEDLKRLTERTVEALESIAKK